MFFVVETVSNNVKELCLKYEMKDEFHNVVQTGTNSASLSDIDVKNLTAGIEHFAKCSRKRKKRV